MPARGAHDVLITTWLFVVLPLQRELRQLWRPKAVFLSKHCCSTRAMHSLTACPTSCATDATQSTAESSRIGIEKKRVETAEAEKMAAEAEKAEKAEKDADAKKDD